MNSQVCNLYLLVFGQDRIIKKFIGSFGSGHEAERQMLLLVRKPWFNAATMELCAKWEKPK